MNKARITYRFDGQGRGQRERKQPPPVQEPKVIPLYEEEFRVIEEEPARAAAEPEERFAERRDNHVLNEFTTDFGPYRSPFEEETERVERIIRQAGRADGETGHAEPRHAEPRHVETGHAEPRHAEPRHVETGHAEPRHAEPRHVEPRRVESGHVETGHAERGNGITRTRAEEEAKRAAILHEAGHAEQYREPFATGYEGFRSEPQGPSYDWGEPQIGARYVRSSTNPPWTRLVLSVTGAVVTGAIFGFLVLSMFTDGGLPFQLFGGKKAPVASSAGADAGTGGGTAAAGSGAGAAGAKPDAAAADKTASSGANAASLVAVNLPARSYSFLQNGIFSTQAAAQAQEAELKKKGYASAAESTDKTTVYAGFALQKEDAVSLANRLKADKFDVFVKTLDVPAAPKLKWSGKASAGELSGFFQQGDKLLQMIGALTVLHLGETKPAALETSTLNAVKSTHQTWNAASAPVTSGASEDVAPYLQQMAKGLDTAVVSLDEYNKAPSASLLWSTQSALMQYVLAERSLLTKLAAQ